MLVSWVDSLPSDNITVTIQLVKGGPLSPSSKGPHINDIAELAMFDRFAARTNRFAADGDDDTKTHVSLRNEGNSVLEKKVRGKASDGNVPVMVIAASPAYDKVLGSTLKEAGEKSRIVTALGRMMINAGTLITLKGCNSKNQM